jgi:hypothetical protein
LLRRFQSRAKDQGDRPTCVAFAVSAFHEFWCDCHLGKQDKVDIDLSEEFLHFCSKQRDGLSKGKGTTISAACEALGNEGQCLEVLHPYQRSSAFPVVPSSQAVSDAKRRKLSLIKRVDVDLAKLVEHFAAGAPVIGVIELFRGAFRVTGTELRNLDAEGLGGYIGVMAIAICQEGLILQFNCNF